MKAHRPALLLPCLLLVAAAGHAQEIRGPDGAALSHARVAGFDGAVFRVEHDGGIAKVPFDAMPATYRAGAVPDPDRAKIKALQGEAANEQAARNTFLATRQRLQVLGMVTAKTDRGFAVTCDHKQLPKWKPSAPREYYWTGRSWLGGNTFVPPCKANAEWQVDDWVVFVGYHSNEDKILAADRLHLPRPESEMMIEGNSVVIGHWDHAWDYTPKDITAPSSPATPPPARPSPRQEIVLAKRETRLLPRLNEWVRFLGADPLAIHMTIGADEKRQDFPMRRGLEGSGNNETVILERYGRRLIYVDTVRSKADSGVFVIEEAAR